MTHLAQPLTAGANERTAVELDIVLCTTQGRHVLNDVAVPSSQWEERQVDCDPLFLGYECHSILQERIGDYDYYGYMEDDLVLHDGWFLQKLRWFNSQLGNNLLLQPNRYEVAQDRSGRKAYIDGDLTPAQTRRYQETDDRTVICLQVMHIPVLLRRTLNPHAGCFFLNEPQMRHWSQQEYFLDRDRSFFSPLESAATAGIMRTFAIFKPTRQTANFLEVEHMGDAWMKKIAQRNAQAQKNAGVAENRSNNSGKSKKDQMNQEHFTS